MVSRAATLPPRSLYRVDEVAHILAVHPRTVYRMIEKEELPAVRVRRAVRIRREDLEQLLVVREESSDVDATG